MSELIFANALVVTRTEAFRGVVRIADDRIAEIERRTTVPAGALDCEGDWLIPGLVELHTDVLERHVFPRPGVRWPETAAVMAYDAQLASAGVTTAFDSLAVGYVFDSGQRPRDPRSLAEAIRTAQAQGMLRAEHFLHIRCEVGTAQLLEDFAPFTDDPMVRLVSLMDHTPGQRQFVSVDKYRQYYQGKYGLTDPQMDELIASRLVDQERYAARHRAEITRQCSRRPTPRAPTDWPSWPARPIWCAGARTRATSPRPTWRGAICSTSSPPTTCRPACSTAPTCYTRAWGSCCRQRSPRSRRPSARGSTVGAPSSPATVPISSASG